MIELLDTREQKSPRFLPEYFPNLTSFKMDQGDISFHEMGEYYNLTELKIGNDFGLHTEQIERLTDELDRMFKYKKELDKIDSPTSIGIFCIWLKKEYSGHAANFFHSLCNKNGVRGFITSSRKGFISILKKIRSNEIIQHKIFIKRDHTPISLCAKMLRQINGVGSELAVKLSQGLNGLFELTRGITADAIDGIEYRVGYKKDGTPKKLALKIIQALEGK